MMPELVAEDLSPLARRFCMSCGKAFYVAHDQAACREASSEPLEVRLSRMGFTASEIERCFTEPREFAARPRPA